MEGNVSLVYSAGHIAMAFFATVMWFRFWPITRHATLRLFSRSWVHYVARLGVWIFLPAMFFVDKDTQNLLMVSVFLCCQPVVVRWVIAADESHGSPGNPLEAQTSP